MNIWNAILAFLLLLGTFPLCAGENDESDFMIEPQAESAKKDISGLLDISFKNDYITPRGLLVSDTGLTVQILSILMFDLYHNPNGNRATLSMGVWNNIWTDQGDPYAGAWNELDWFVGIDFTFRKSWRFGVQYFQFLSPPHHFKPENNIEFIIAYDDSIWERSVVFKPYIKLFWTVSGDSTVVLGRKGNTFDVEIGMIPTLDISKYNCRLPWTLKAPTWITVGPAAFWNGGPQGLKHVKTNLGVFSTGLKAEIPIKFIPERLGHWIFYIECRYYHLFNKNLLEAQKTTLGLSSIHSAHRNIGVGCTGIGMSY